MAENCNCIIADTEGALVKGLEADGKNFAASPQPLGRGRLSFPERRDNGQVVAQRYHSLALGADAPKMAPRGEDRAAALARATLHWRRQRPPRSQLPN